MSILPPDALQQISVWHNDDQMDPLVRYEKVCQVLLALSPDVQQKIMAFPPPTVFDGVPEYKAKMDAIRNDSTLSFREKLAKNKEVIASMPKDLLMGVRGQMKHTIKI
ncbi:unnamed protein product, partial [Mesorhabditis spiculigera]